MKQEALKTIQKLYELLDMVNEDGDITDDQQIAACTNLEQIEKILQ